MKNDVFKIKVLTVVLFVLMLILPVWQMLFHYFPETYLVGYVPTAKYPAFTLSKWYNEDFQKGITSWFSQRLGFRAYFIRTDNQLTYWLFGEVGTPVIVGKDGYLIEKTYIDDFNGKGQKNIEYFEAQVKKLKLLQDKLLSMKKGFVLLLNPGKPRLFPEYIPDRFRLSSTPEANIDLLVPLLDKYKINYVNTDKLFRDLKAQSKYPLFVTGGTHWSDYGSCLATRDVFKMFSKQTGINYADIDCEDVVLAKPDQVARDLSDLANIWYPNTFNTVAPYPKIKLLNKEKIVLPKMLIVGDSFVWNMLNNMKQVPIIGNTIFYYYYNQVYTYPGTRLGDLDKKTLDLKKVINDSDVVLIQEVDSALKNFGFGFVEDANDALNK